MPTVKEAASTFLASKRIAVTGVSRKPQRHGSNAVYKQPRERGYQVFVVNPSEGEVEGDDEDLAVLLCSGTWCRRWARSATGSRTCAPQTSGQFSGTGGPSCAGSSRCRSASPPDRPALPAEGAGRARRHVAQVLAAHSRRARSRRLICWPSRVARPRPSPGLPSLGGRRKDVHDRKTQAQTESIVRAFRRCRGGLIGPQHD